MPLNVQYAEHLGIESEDVQWQLNWGHAKSITIPHDEIDSPSQTRDDTESISQVPMNSCLDEEPAI